MTVSKKPHFATTASFIMAANLGVTFVFSALLLAISILLEDWIFVGILGGVCLYQFVSGLVKAFGTRHKIYLIIASGSLIMGGVQIATVLIRWDYWLERYRSVEFSKIYDESYDVGAWIPISIIVLVALLLGTQFYSLHTKNNRFRTADMPKYE